MGRYLCVLDFEATCWDIEPKKHIQEIIEFPSVLYEYMDDNSVRYVSEFSKYVKPVFEPILSKFCTELTGITQDKVDSGECIEDVYESHHEWLTMHTQPNSEIYIATCGAWDLNTMLPKEIANKHLPYYSVYKRFINVKTEFEQFYQRKAYGMSGMLEFLNLSLDGRLHSGIDDTKNIAKILLKMISDGHVYFTHIFVNKENDWKKNDCKKNDWKKNDCKKK
jgi:inhibitor of KinA sporulation pathway (predicted exonuclease)